MNISRRGARTCDFLIRDYLFGVCDLEFVAANALGIGAASFASGASKDIAESPTASPERPKTIHNSQCIMHN